MNLEGKLLGSRYEIIEKIGNGGMATVYKAKDLVLKRYVAVKILREEYTTDNEFIKRFNTEAESAAKYRTDSRFCFFFSCSSLFVLFLPLWHSDRQFHLKDGSLQITFYPHLSMMQFRNLLYNRKSKSRPAGIAAPRLLCPVKFLENMIQQRLATEVALFADKASIDEELVTTHTRC